MNGIDVLPNGQWVIQNDTHLSAWAKDHGNIVTDPWLFKWLLPKIEDCNVVWDVGANIGDHAKAYLDAGKTVVAIEPNPIAFECLAHNCPEAILYNIAASDKEETLKFDVLDNVGASRISKSGQIEVECLPLGQLGTIAPDFIKIDVEGWELHALKGIGEVLLSSCHPKMFIELNKGALAANGHTSEMVLDYLRTLGYTSFQIYPESASFDDLQFDVFVEL